MFKIGTAVRLPFMYLFRMGLILIFFADAQADICHSITNGNFCFSSKHIIFDLGILYNLHFVCLGPMPENIFGIGQVIDAIEEGVQTGSNAVHGIINDIEDQTGQNDLNLNCVGQKSTGECIQDNLNRFEKKTKNFFMEIYGKACVKDYQCSLTSYCSSCKCLK